MRTYTCDQAAGDVWAVGFRRHHTCAPPHLSHVLALLDALQMIHVSRCMQPAMTIQHNYRESRDRGVGEQHGAAQGAVAEEAGSGVESRAGSHPRPRMIRRTGPGSVMRFDCKRAIPPRPCAPPGWPSAAYLPHSLRSWRHLHHPQPGPPG